MLNIFSSMPFMVIIYLKQTNKQDSIFTFQVPRKKQTISGSTLALKKIHEVLQASGLHFIINQTPWGNVNFTWEQVALGHGTGEQVGQQGHGVQGLTREQEQGAVQVLGKIVASLLGMYKFSHLSVQKCPNTQYKTDLFCFNKFLLLSIIIIYLQVEQVYIFTYNIAKLSSSWQVHLNLSCSLGILVQENLAPAWPQYDVRTCWNLIGQNKTHFMTAWQARLLV